MSPLWFMAFVAFGVLAGWLLMVAIVALGNTRPIRRINRWAAIDAARRDPLSGGSLSWRRDDEQGVTLVEMMVVLLIMGIAGSIMVGALVTGTRLSVLTAQRAYAVQETTIAVERVTGDLRHADTVTMPDDGCGSSLGFVVAGESYEWSHIGGASLVRTPGSSLPVDNDPGRPVFRWYDVDGQELPDCQGTPWRVDVEVVRVYSSDREAVGIGTAVLP